MTELSHCVSVRCGVPAAAAFALLSDGSALGTWALGCWGAEDEGDGVVAGTSLFDGSRTRVRPRPSEERLLVDYEVGGVDGPLVPRISARVVPGPVVGLPEDTCVVSLTAWRTASMDDERWQQLVRAHEAEALLLRGRIEDRGVAAAAVRRMDVDGGNP